MATLVCILGMLGIHFFAQELREYKTAATIVMGLTCFAGFLASLAKARKGTIFFLSMLALIFTFRIATISNKIFVALDRSTGIKDIGMIPMGLTLGIAIYILTSFVFRLEKPGLAFLLQGAVYGIAFKIPKLFLDNYQLVDHGMAVSISISVFLSSLIWTRFIVGQR